jgi:ubiquinol-cytochrome c reductase cytochrome b subunit
LSLFFTGLILMVFAGLFHVYRYAMSEAKKPPPPPPKAEPALEHAPAKEIKAEPQKELPPKTETS